MRVTFFGSPVEAVPALRILHGSGFEITAVYTRPDRPAGRSRNPVPTPVRVAAEELGLEVKTPDSLRRPGEVAELRSLDADAFVVVAYGRILPAEALSAARLGAVNVHPSLLPKYRGPSPVATAILDGVSETGVTVMLLDEGMDTGPILRQQSMRLDGTQKCGELTARLFELGAEMLPGVLEDLESGSLSPMPQDDAIASVTSLLKREDGDIDWSQPAVQVERMVRAYDPWPGTHTTWGGKTLKILGARVDEREGDPGRVTVSNNEIIVGCGRGSLWVSRLQIEGRKAVDAREFLNGNPGFDGALLGS